jgi:hypothetical protein
MPCRLSHAGLCVLVELHWVRSLQDNKAPSSGVMDPVRPCTAAVPSLFHITPSTGLWPCHVDSLPMSHSECETHELQHAIAYQTRDVCFQTQQPRDCRCNIKFTGSRTKPLLSTGLGAHLQAMGAGLGHSTDCPP